VLGNTSYAPARPYVLSFRGYSHRTRVRDKATPRTLPASSADLLMLGHAGQSVTALSALAGTVRLSFSSDSAAASSWSFREFCASGPQTSRRARAAAAREAGGPLSWKAFCSARGWFVTSAAQKREVDADGINRNCASLLNGGVLRWSLEEEDDARAHQVACWKRGEVVSVSEFATPRFHPFIDADAERSGVPDPTHLGLDIARIAQRELRQFCVSASTRSGGGGGGGGAGGGGAAGASSERTRRNLFNAVVLVAPPKELSHAPSYAIAAGAPGGSAERWYKRGYHVVFPNVLVSVHEWRHLLAAVAAACGRALKERDPRYASPWHLTIDVACGPNLRAPFSDKATRCENCARDGLRGKRPRCGPSSVPGPGGRGAAASVLIVHGRDSGAEGSASSDSAAVGEGAEALRAVRELGTPEGRHRNSSSCCSNKHCVDGYVPEGRPYTVHAVLDGDGAVDEHVTQRALRSHTFAYSLASIRAPGAKFSYPEFRIYDGAPSVEDALRRANKDPAAVLRVPAAALAPRDAKACSRSLTHPAVLSGGDAAARESIARMAHRVAITDEARIRCMLRNAQKLHRCFEGVIADKAWTNRQRSYCILVVTGEASRRCLNLLPGREPDDGIGGSGGGAASGHVAANKSTLPGAHRAPKRAYFLYSADNGTVTQRCWCKCETGEGRVNGQWCKGFKSYPRQLAAADRMLLFGSAKGRPRMSAKEIAASFRLSKGNDILLPARPGAVETRRATAVGTVARQESAGVRTSPAAGRVLHPSPTPATATPLGIPALLSHARNLTGPAEDAAAANRVPGSGTGSRGSNYARQLLAGRQDVWSVLLSRPRARGDATDAAGGGDGGTGGVAGEEQKRRRKLLPKQGACFSSDHAGPDSAPATPHSLADAATARDLVVPVEPRSLTMDEALVLRGRSRDGDHALRDGSLYDDKDDRERGDKAARPALLDLVLLGSQLPPGRR